jgi:hypothetical protein
MLVIVIGDQLTLDSGSRSAVGVHDRTLPGQVEVPA